jgi:hypothetical protein
MKVIQDELNEIRTKLSDQKLKVKLDSKVEELTSKVGWFKKEALLLKNDLTENKIITQEARQTNFVLTEEKYALEQALGRQQVKSKALEDTLIETQQQNKQMLQIIQEQQTEINSLKKAEVKRQIFAEADQQGVFLTEKAPEDAGY